MHEAIDPREARVGDRLAVQARRGRPVGEIVEVLGEPDRPYFRVRWEDGRESVVHPGLDARVLAAAGHVAPARPSASPQERPAEATGAGRPFTTLEAQESPLRASAGDRLLVHHHHLGEKDRDAEILEVLGPDGQPPYRVRWSEDGHESIIRPGTDVEVQHFEHPPDPAPRRSRKRTP